MKKKLIELLADGRRYFKNELCHLLQLSPQGIDLIIEQLQTLGVDIEKQDETYRIINGLDLLNKTEMVQYLNPHYHHALDDIVILSEVDTTMNYLKNWVPSNQKLACFAEYQSQARGQHGRQWVSPFGKNIYCSLLWHFDKNPTAILGLSLTIGIAIIRTLQELGIHQQLGLKWPNDVMHQGKKLGGILIDMVSYSASTCSVIIGIGLNTHLSRQQALTINQPWTTLELITQQPVKRNLLGALLIKHIVLTLTQFSIQGFASFLDEWHQYDQFSGKPVTIITPSQQFYGIMSGVSPKGELILVDKHQKEFYFLSGEVSLRPFV